MIQTNPAGRRQARFLPDQVIVPTGVSTSAWYDICAGRRRDDRRAGMVLLNLGGPRMLVPDNCLEFRSAPASVPALVARAATATAAIMTRPKLALAASVCMAVLAIGTLAGGFAIDR